MNPCTELLNNSPGKELGYLHLPRWWRGIWISKTWSQIHSPIPPPQTSGFNSGNRDCGLAIWGTTLSAPPGEQGKYIWLNRLCYLTLSKRKQTKTVIVKVCEKITFREAACTTYHRGSLQAFVSAHGIPGLTEAARKAVKQIRTVLSRPGFPHWFVPFCGVRSAPCHRWDELALPVPSYKRSLASVHSSFQLWLWGGLLMCHLKLRLSSQSLLTPRCHQNTKYAT